MYKATLYREQLNHIYDALKNKIPLLVFWQEVLTKGSIKFYQRESFRCYRTDIADTIMYCYNILRDVLLEKMLKHVDEASTLNLQVRGLRIEYLLS